MLVPWPGRRASQPAPSRSRTLALATAASALTRPLDKATSATACKDTKEIHTFNPDAKMLTSVLIKEIVMGPATIRSDTSFVVLREQNMIQEK